MLLPKTPPSTFGPRSYLAAVGAVFIVYLIAAVIGLRFDAVSGFATLVWPPTGIALAVLLLFGYRLWPGILAGAILANLATGATAGAAIGIGVGNMLEALLGAYLLRRAGFQNNVGRVQDILLLVSRAALLSTMVSATIGVSVLWFSGVVTTQTLATTWRAWWIGDMLGALIIAPLILTWFTRWRQSRIRPGEITEGAALIGTLVLVNLFVFAGPFTAAPAAYPVLALIFIPLLWAALSFEQWGVSTANFILATTAVIGTAYGYGPFVQQTLSAGLLPLQLFMALMAISAMVLAATVAERQRTVHELAQHAAELKARRLLLEQAQAKDAALLESLGEAIVAIGLDWKIVLVNQAFAQLVGQSETKLFGQLVDDAMHIQSANGQPIAQAQCALGQALITGQRIQMSDRNVVRADGTKVSITMTASPIILEGKVIGAVNVLHDVTQEREIERAKNEFVSLASHQLRTPLSIISWHLEVVLRDIQEWEVSTKHHHYLRTSYQATRRLLGMVSALLHISRIEARTFATQPHLTDVSQLVAGVLEEFASEINKKSLRVEPHIDTAVPRVHIDPAIMRMVLQNLISNAIKYTPPKGKIRIAVEYQESHVVLRVADTGYGIPLSAQKKMFTKFFRADNAVLHEPDGNGLGLYIVKSVLEQAGGTIQFESIENQGTSFSVLVPLTAAKRTRVTYAGPTEAINTGKKS